MARLGDTTVYGNLAVTGEITAPIFNGVATQAYYADLAEKYYYNKTLFYGMVVQISDSKTNEIEPCHNLSKTVIGVISENPAYLMNSTLKNGKCVGLIGRLPVYVKGKIKKGDFIVPFHNGCARKGRFWEFKYKFGIALETNDDKNLKLVECIIK